MTIWCKMVAKALVICVYRWIKIGECLVRLTLASNERTKVPRIRVQTSDELRTKTYVTVFNRILAKKGLPDIVAVEVWRTKNGVFKDSVTLYLVDWPEEK